MSSDFKIAQCIEWCTDLPTYNHPRESPVFMLNGNEWIFRFVLQFETEWCYEDEMEIYLSYENRIKTYWSYELYLEHKNERMDCELCSVDFKVGYEGEGTFSLGKGVFNVSEHRCIWSCCWLNCLKKIKFRFNFHNAVKPPLKNSNETGEQFC